MPPRGTGAGTRRPRPNAWLRCGRRGARPRPARTRRCRRRRCGRLAARPPQRPQEVVTDTPVHATPAGDQDGVGAGDGLGAPVHLHGEAPDPHRRPGAAAVREAVPGSTGDIAPVGAEDLVGHRRFERRHPVHQDGDDSVLRPDHGRILANIVVHAKGRILALMVIRATGVATGIGRRWDPTTGVHHAGPRPPDCDRTAASLPRRGRGMDAGAAVPPDHPGRRHAPPVRAPRAVATGPGPAQVSSGRGWGGGGPTYVALGRIRRLSAACSRMCEHHPMTRLDANVGVNISRGRPHVSITIPA